MCIFCKIANGEIPSYTIYENEYVKCFLDISQATVGHTLIVPKKHYENFFDLPENEAIEVIKAAKVVTNILVDKLGVKNCNLLNNSGSLAGQTVMHFHMHVIPRYENDGLEIKFKESNPTNEELVALYNKLIK